MKFKKFVREIIPYCVDNIFIFFHDSELMEIVDDELCSLGPVVNKIVYGEVGKFEIEKYFSPKFLEDRFGGEFKNLKEFWPPRCIQDATKTLDENDLLLHDIMPFTFNISKLEAYRKTRDTETTTDLSKLMKKKKCKF